jgi:hypothetical protein
VVVVRLLPRGGRPAGTAFPSGAASWLGERSPCSRSEVRDSRAGGLGGPEEEAEVGGGAVEVEVDADSAEGSHHAGEEAAASAAAVALANAAAVTS